MNRYASLFDQEPRRCLRSLPVRLRHPVTKSRALVAGSCVKYREISDKMVTDIAATSAEAVLAGDLGCLLKMARKLYRQARQVEVRHVAEVLAGMADRVPAIGAPR